MSNEVQKGTLQTPIEIALGIDENGMTTAKKLYEFLGMDRSNYSRWVKRNITENEFAESGVDFYSSDVTSEGKGNFAEDFKLTARFAKKLSMMQKNERGEEARDYFTTVEDKAKQYVVNRSQLSPQMQMLYGMLDGQAKIELEQKRQKEQLEKLEQTQNVIVDTFKKADDTEDFQKWANDRIAQIAESPKFDKGYGRSKNYSMARAESYERLKQKRNCRLDDRVQKAIGRALEERPDIKKSELQKINKIYIIANDKDLRPAYELIIKEMMLCYCVEVKL